MWLLLVGLLTFAVYLPAIGYEFAYDSYVQVGVDNFIHIHRHLWDVLSLRVMGMDIVDFNRPVNLATLIFDSMLWGRDTPGYHLTSILFHAGAAILLFRFLKQITKANFASAIAALVFAVHPLQVEAVVEVGNREDLLATFFVLLAMNLALTFRPNEQRGLRLWGHGALIALSTLLAVGSKESGVALPPVLAVYWLLFRRKERALPWISLILACGAVCGAFLVARFTLEASNSAIFAEKAPRIWSSFSQWIAIQSRIYAAELVRIVRPSGLCADYNGYSIRNFTPLLSGLGLLCVIAMQIYGSFRSRLVALGVAVFWFSLLPVSNLIPIYRPMADRFLYLPLSGVAIMLAPLLASVRPQAVLAGVAVPMLGLLSFCTFKQEQVWKDRISLWTDTAQKNPFSFNAWLGIGYAELDNNHFRESATGFQKAIQCSKGKQAEPFAGLALAADHLGMHSKAEQLYAHAVKVESKFSDPDKLATDLVLTPLQAQELKVIALRSNKL